MYKLLNDNDHFNHDILSNLGRFSPAQTLRRLNFEKQQGVSAVQLIMALYLFRINGESIFSMYRRNFHDLLSTDKNNHQIFNRKSPNRLCSEIAILSRTDICIAAHLYEDWYSYSKRIKLGNHLYHPFVFKIL